MSPAFLFFPFFRLFLQHLPHARADEYTDLDQSRQPREDSAGRMEKGKRPLCPADGLD